MSTVQTGGAASGPVPGGSTTDAESKVSSLKVRLQTRPHIRLASFHTAVFHVPCQLPDCLIGPPPLVRVRCEGHVRPC